MSLKKTSLVLLSAGLDSTVNLYQAKQKTKVKLVLTVDYGQKAAKQEIKKSKSLCKKLGLPWLLVKLPFLGEISHSSLNKPNKKIPIGSAVKISSLKKSIQSAKSVWVPNRNGVFLNVAAAYADSLNIDLIIPGFNKEEAQTFPDNSQGFLQAVTQSLAYSTRQKAKVKCYTVHMNKSQIVALGQKLKVDWSLIWPCYQSGKKWCGQCESCQRALRAFQSQKSKSIEKFFLTDLKSSADKLVS